MTVMRVVFFLLIACVVHAYDKFVFKRTKIGCRLGIA